MPDLTPIPPQAVESTWPRILPLIEKGCRRTDGKMTPDGIKDRLLKDAWRLWLVWKADDEVSDPTNWQARAPGLVISEYFFEISGERTATVIFLSGRGIRHWAWEMLGQFEFWAVKEGCTHVRLEVATGIARMIGDDLGEYRKTHIVFEKRLTKGQSHDRQITNGNDHANGERAAL